MNPSFERYLWLSTVPLVSVDTKGTPTGIASGCFVTYSGKKLLLSVQHATGNGSIWAIQQQYIPNEGVELYRLGGVNFLKRGNIKTNKFVDVDFSYVEVPEGTFAKRQEISPITLEIKSEESILVLNPSFEEKPAPSLSYGFSGLVKPSLEQHPNILCLASEPRVYSGLRYLRTDGDYHYFKLPFPHPGHDHFKGCSGAPIISSTGQLVALVCGGDIATNELWGISLQAYKLPIDILVGNI